MHSVSPVYTSISIYYVGSVAVLRAHCTFSLVALLSFCVLVVHWLARSESRQVWSIFVVATLDGKAVLGSSQHYFSLTSDSLSS